MANKNDVTIYGKFIEAKSGEFETDDNKTISYANIRALVGNREVKFKSDLTADKFKDCEEGDGILLECSLKPNAKQIAQLVVTGFTRDVK